MVEWVKNGQKDTDRDRTTGPARTEPDRTDYVVSSYWNIVEGVIQWPGYN